jgi:hypothetical protein
MQDRKRRNKRMIVERNCGEHATVRDRDRVGSDVEVRNIGETTLVPRDGGYNCRTKRTNQRITGRYFPLKMGGPGRKRKRHEIEMSCDNNDHINRNGRKSYAKRKHEEEGNKNFCFFWRRKDVNIKEGYEDVNIK